MSAAELIDRLRAWPSPQIGADYSVNAIKAQMAEAADLIEALSAHPAPIKPSGDTGELRERVAKIVDPAGFDDRWDVPGLRHEASLDERVDEALAKADAILDLIRKATTPKAGEGSPIGQNDQPGLAFSDASEP